jgi:hypothetical protein
MLLQSDNLRSAQSLPGVESRQKIVGWRTAGTPFRRKKLYDYRLAGT